MYPLTLEVSFDCPASAGDAEDVRQHCFNALEAAFARGLLANGTQILVGPSLLTFWPGAPPPGPLAAEFRWTAGHQAIMGAGVVEVFDGPPVQVHCSFSLAPLVPAAAAVGFIVLGYCLALNVLSPLTVGFAVVLALFAYLAAVGAASDIDSYLRRAVGAPLVARASRGFWIAVAVLLLASSVGLLWASANGPLGGLDIGGP